MCTHLCRFEGEKPLGLNQKVMELTPETIATITAYLDATTPLPAQADLLFVFGSRQLTAAQLAVELYRKYPTAYVVVTGGENRHTGHNEANAHYEVLIKAGVAGENIIVENRSTNTLENVTFALPLIEQKIALASLQSVVAICKWMHSRRALMTLKRHLPGGIHYYAHTYETEGVTRENWYQNPRTDSANVLKNWERIPIYLERGHLEDIMSDADHYV